MEGPCTTFNRIAVVQAEASSYESFIQKCRKASVACVCTGMHQRMLRAWDCVGDTPIGALIARVQVKMSEKGYKVTKVKKHEQKHDAVQLKGWGARFDLFQPGANISLAAREFQNSAVQCPVPKSFFQIVRDSNPNSIGGRLLQSR